MNNRLKEIRRSNLADERDLCGNGLFFGTPSSKKKTMNTRLKEIRDRHDSIHGEVFAHKDRGELLKMLERVAELTRYEYIPASADYVPNDNGRCVSYEKLQAILEDKP